MKRILIVENERLLGKSLCKCLSGDEREIYLSDSAESALQTIEEVQSGEERIDVILTDMVLPDMNGVEFYREVRRISPDTVGIMMTAKISNGLEDEISETGFHYLINKPFDIDEIREMIENVLSRFP